MSFFDIFKSQSAKLWKLADVNKDGKVNGKDLKDDNCKALNKEILKELGVTAEGGKSFDNKDALKAEVKSQDRTVSDLIKKAKAESAKYKDGQKPSLELDQAPAATTETPEETPVTTGDGTGSAVAPATTNEANAEEVAAANAAVAESPEETKNENPKTYKLNDPEAKNAKDGDFAVDNNDTYKMVNGEWQKVDANNRNPKTFVMDSPEAANAQNGDFAVKDNNTYKMIDGKWQQVKADGSTKTEETEQADDAEGADGNAKTEKWDGKSNFKIGFESPEQIPNEDMRKAYISWKDVVNGTISEKKFNDAQSNAQIGGGGGGIYMSRSIDANFLKENVISKAEPKLLELIYGKGVDVSKLSDQQIMDGWWNYRANNLGPNVIASEYDRNKGVIYTLQPSMGHILTDGD